MEEAVEEESRKPFVLFVTPSDIAFILSLIMNGMGMWDQARRQQDNPTQEESKALPLFTKGEGRKRESGMTVWNNEGRNFYYTAEKNWKKVYNNKDECLICVINGNNGSQKTRVGRIQSGRTGGIMRNRKMMMRRRNRMNHGGNWKKIKGTMMRVMRSRNFIGMTMLKKGMRIVVTNNTGGV